MIVLKYTELYDSYKQNDNWTCNNCIICILAASTTIAFNLLPYTIIVVLELLEYWMDDNKARL